jgi:adenosylhomocysteine nucleosidase
MGKKRAEAAGCVLLDRYAPEGLISLGFAGGLRPGLRPGALVVLERVSLREEPGQTEAAPHFDADPALVRQAVKALGGAGLSRTSGLGLTSLRVVGNAGEKQQLGRLTGALTVDLEGYWLAALCRARGVPFLAVRAILDATETTLPPFITAQGDSGIGSRWGLMSGLAQPWWLPRLVSLWQAMRVAQTSLAEFAAALLGWSALAERGAQS